MLAAAEGCKHAVDVDGDALEKALVAWSCFVEKSGDLDIVRVPHRSLAMLALCQWASCSPHVVATPSQPGVEALMSCVSSTLTSVHGLLSVVSDAAHKKEIEGILVDLIDPREVLGSSVDAGVGKQAESPPTSIVPLLVETAAVPSWWSSPSRWCCQVLGELSHLLPKPLSGVFLSQVLRVVAARRFAQLEVFLPDPGLDCVLKEVLDTVRDSIAAAEASVDLQVSDATYDALHCAAMAHCLNASLWVQVTACESGTNARNEERMASLDTAHGILRSLFDFGKDRQSVVQDALHFVLPVRGCHGEVQSFWREKELECANANGHVGL